MTVHTGSRFQRMIASMTGLDDSSISQLEHQVWIKVELECDEYEVEFHFRPFSRKTSGIQL